MSVFKFLWTTHKWTGIILGLVFVNIAATGFLLLLKKDYAWIQPPTQKGAPGKLENLASLQDVIGAVLREKHPAFTSFDDIDRIDFRPGKRVHKVRSKNDYVEIQVDAVTAEILLPGFRTSDLIEQLHDGSWYGDWVHAWLMPLAAVSLVFLVFSGVYIWLAPVLKKRRRRLEKRS